MHSIQSRVDVMGWWWCAREVDGEWSSWSSWSACDPDCRRHRQRFCDSPAPLNDGRQCDGSDLGADNCTQLLCTGSPPPPSYLSYTVYQGNRRRQTSTICARLGRNQYHAAGVLDPQSDKQIGSPQYSAPTPGRSDQWRRQL